MKITRKNEFIYKYDDYGLIISGVFLAISILIIADGLSIVPMTMKGISLLEDYLLNWPCYYFRFGH